MSFTKGFAVGCTLTFLICLIGFEVGMNSISSSSNNKSTIEYLESSGYSDVLLDRDHMDDFAHFSAHCKGNNVTGRIQIMYDKDNKKSYQVELQ